MATGNLVKFMISILLVSMFVSIFALFLSGMKEGYGDREGMTEEDLHLFDKLSNISSTTSEIQDATNQDVDDNVFDVIGNYFKAGWTSLKLSKQSLDVVAGEDGIVNAAIDQTQLGEGGQIIGNTMIAIILVLILLGVIVTVLLKWQL